MVVLAKEFVEGHNISSNNPFKVSLLILSSEVHNLSATQVDRVLTFHRTVHVLRDLWLCLVHILMLVLYSMQ